MSDLTLIEPADPTFQEFVQNFAPLNRDAAGLEYDSFCLIQRQGGKIAIGGRGDVYLQTLEVRGLWVDAALRGQGWGSKLLAQIEQVGRDKGAKVAKLYTYSWQAEGFYLTHGYTRYATFTFPTGQARYDLSKPL